MLGGEEIQTLQLFNCYMKQGAYKPFQLFNCYKHLLQSHIGELEYRKIRYKLKTARLFDMDSISTKSNTVTGDPRGSPVTVLLFVDIESMSNSRAVFNLYRILRYSSSPMWLCSRCL